MADAEGSGLSAWSKYILYVCAPPSVPLEEIRALLRAAAEGGPGVTTEETEVEKFRRLIEEGVDFHTAVARSVFGDDYTKEQRDQCKCAAFTCLYGAARPRGQRIAFKRLYGGR